MGRFFSLEVDWELTALHRKRAVCYEILCRTADFLDLGSTVMIFDYGKYVVFVSRPRNSRLSRKTLHLAINHTDNRPSESEMLVSRFVCFFNRCEINRKLDVILSRSGHKHGEGKYFSPSYGIWPLILEPMYVLFTDCGFAMNMDTSVCDKYVCYGKERLKHAKKNQRKDTKEQKQSTKQETN